MTTSERDAYAYLTITSEHHALHEITSAMGCAPDGASWSRGDARKTGMGHYNFSRWSLMSGVAKGAPLEAHFAALVARIAPLQGALDARPEAFQARISVTGWVSAWDDRIALSAKVLRDLSCVGVPLDFDLYAERED